MSLSEGGLVNKNPQNNSNGHFIHNYSHFPDSLSRSRVYTARFGEYTPSFVFDGVEKDEISVNSVDRVDSYSLNSPFKGTIRKIKETFCVPKMALLPINWDRIYVQPSNGDDVPKDANCVLLDFPSAFTAYWQRLHTLCKNSAAVTNEATFCSFLTACMRMLVYGEYYFSEGSLLAYCGYHGNAQIEFNQNDPSYDHFFDDSMRYLFGNILYINVSFGSYGTSSYRVKKYIGLSGARPSDFDFDRVSSFRDFITDFREDPSARIISITAPGAPDYATIQTTYKNAGLGRTFRFILPSSSGLDDDLKDMLPTSLNLSRPLSYQMLCHHFYSNSGVDFIYTAELFRQYIYNLCLKCNNEGRTSYFVQNGINVQFDILSGHVLKYNMFFKSAPTYADLTADIADTEGFLYQLILASSIFTFRRSLRFMDYFVGSRTRPLAPFNSDVSVNNNSVSVIDITKRIQGQRFANSVMRVRSKIENYVKGLFGEAPAPDYHNPFSLLVKLSLFMVMKFRILVSVRLMSSILILVLV